jgi:peroxiredoxin
MKFLKFCLFCFLALNFVKASAQQRTYHISGIIEPTLNISKLFFTPGSFYGKSNAKASEIDVVNGKFTITGSLADPSPAFLSLTKDYKADSLQVKEFILDEGTITISIKEKLSDAIIKGSKAYDDMMRYTTEQSPYNAELNEINEKAQQQVMAGISPDSINALYRIPFKDATRSLLRFQKRFIISHPDAFVSLLLIPDIANASYNFFEADSLFKLLSAKNKSYPTAKMVKEFIDAQIKVSVGASAPLFSMADTSGKTISLSSIKGKYVLLDFWAAWCAPCREENPNVVQAYKTFKNKGFTVLGVSLDRSREDWMKAIHKDNLTWQHVSDLRQWENSAAVLYGVTGIPHNFLIDPRGKIIARDLRGPELTDKLNEIFR